MAIEPYWFGKVPDTDNFGFTITDEFVDGRCDPLGSYRGTWAIFSPYSWNRYGCGQLGEGCGQRYVRRADGKFYKVEG